MDRKQAWVIISLFGLISLLGDIIYEGARSINGQYLSILGASAFAVGVVVGIGEFLGYIFRLLSGFLSDRLSLYWPFLFLGYGLLITVPLLSLSDFWQFAAVLVILERVGKGVRSPVKDALISKAVEKVGSGTGFGLLELVDQVGALLGPLFIFLLFLYMGEKITSLEYKTAFELMWIPFILLISVLGYTYFRFKDVEKLDKSGEKDQGLPEIFWNFSLFVFFIVFGFVSFALVGYHLKVNHILSDAYIPALYILAMAVDGIFALLLGSLYDRFPVKTYTLFSIPILTMITLPLIFSESISLIIFAVFIWGVVMALHEVVLKAYVVDTVKPEKRASAFGVYNFLYGLATLFGSITAGFLYDLSKDTMILSFLTLEVVGVFILLFVLRKRKITVKG